MQPDLSDIRRLAEKPALSWSECDTVLKALPSLIGELDRLGAENAAFRAVLQPSEEAMNQVPEALDVLRRLSLRQDDLTAQALTIGLMIMAAFRVVRPAGGDDARD